MMVEHHSVPKNFLSNKNHKNQNKNFRYKYISKVFNTDINSSNYISKSYPKYDNSQHIWACNCLECRFNSDNIKEENIEIRQKNMNDLTDSSMEYAKQQHTDPIPINPNNKNQSFPLNLGSDNIN